MSFSTFLVLSFALYLFLNFWLLPHLRRRWAADRTVSKLSKAGAVAAVEFLRDVSLTMLVADVLLALYAWTLSLAYGQNATVLAFVVESAESAHRILESWKGSFEHWTLWVIVAAAVYWGWRRYLRTILSRINGKLRLEIEHTNQEKRADARAWAALSPTPQMIKLQEQIDQCRAEAKEMETRALGSFMVRRKRQELLRRAKRLEVQFARTDLERRLDLRDDTGSRAPQGFWAKVGRALVSQGLVSDLKGSAKILSRGATACLAIALVGVSTSQLSAIVRQRLIHLDQLRVLAQVKEVNRTWEKGVPAPPPTSKVTDSDVQAAHQLADVLGRALARNPAWCNLRQASDEDRAELQRQATRYEIRHRVQLPDQVPGVQTAGTNDLAGMDATEHGAFEAMRSEAGPSGGSRIGEAFARQRAGKVVLWFGGSWDKVKLDLRQHAALYNQPLKFSDVRDGIVDQIVGSAFDRFTPHDNEFTRLIYEALQAGNESVVEQAADTELKKALIALKQGRPLETVTHALSTERLPLPLTASEKMAAALQASQAMPTDRDLAEKLSQAPHAPAYGGSGSGPSAPSVGEAARGVMEAERQSDRVKAETSLDALADYDYYFPATRGDASSSTFAQFLNGFPETAQDASFIPSTSFRVERALDFSMVRGFSRVGGVVIGRDPERRSRSLNFSGLRWTQSGRSITLFLRRDNGKEQTFGPFDQSLVHQALAYAADGRVLSCTMVEAKPLSELKILLNPVLLDTPLGCRIINLDRWVDTYFRDRKGQANKEDEVAEGRINSEHQLYYIAWAARYLALAVEVLKSEEADAASGADASAAKHASNLQRRIDQVTSKMTSREVAESAQEALADPAILTDKAKSLLAAKPDFYDADLVRWIEECSADRPQLQAFISCVRSRSEGKIASLNQNQAEIGQWLAPPPTFQIWSGVRERAYAITDDLSFLLGPRVPTGSENALWPFDFMLQVSFTSAPAFALGSEKPSEYVDQDPWAFPELHADINRTIAQAVEKNATLSEHLREMREFVVLQRLFRVALEGRLGPKFPVEELASLTSATAGRIPFCRTPRWNPRPGDLERNLLVALDDVGRDLGTSQSVMDESARAWLPQAVSDLRACETMIGSPHFYFTEAPDGQVSDTLLTPLLVRVPAQQWNEECRFDRIARLARAICVPGQDTPACRMLGLAEFSQYTAAARELRASLHVDEEGAAPNVCPPLAGATLAAAGGRK